MVETRLFASPHSRTCFGGKSAALSASVCLDPKGLTLSPVIHRPCQGPRGDLFWCQVGGAPQGLRKARAWQRVAARPTRLDLKEAFEYASRSFLNAVALCCDLRCKIKQN
jgi:hypothetical protein